MKHFVFFGFLLAIGELASCSSSGGHSGTGAGGEGQACYPNGTCNAGLTCASHLCVRLPDAGASGGASGSSGTGGASGSGTGGSGGGASGAGGKDAGGGGGAAGATDAGDASTPVCDVIAQTGCAGGEKCAWVRQQTMPVSVGNIACVPDGTVALGGACSSGGASGTDDCKKGLACVNGSCRTICDPAVDSCDANHACSTYAGLFASSNVQPAAGVCDPACNPLTQTLLTDGSANCGGTIVNTMPPHPSLGCYGFPSISAAPTKFTCSSAGPATNTSDVACNDTNGCGTASFPYTNGCAPGFIPLLQQSTVNPTFICVALCEPGNTSATAQANAHGKVGSTYTCPAMGAAGLHECRFWWWREGPNTPIGPSSNTLGFCYDYSQYQYDSNGDGSPDTPEPSCATLSATGHNYSATITDTQFWGCESVTVRPK